MATLRSFWGPIFKDKCGVCLQDSGWVTLHDANVWAREHFLISQHYRFARFMRKNGGRKHATKTI